MESFGFFPFAYPFTFVVVLLLLSIRFLRRRAQSKRPLPPSPPPIPILGHLHLIKKPLHGSLARLAARYGPILSLQLGTRQALVVTSPTAAEECLSKNDTIFANRPRLLSGKHLSYNYTTIFWAPYSPLWRNLRRIATVEILSSIRLNSSSRIRKEEVTSMLRRLGEEGERSFKKVCLKPRLYEFTYNVMMRMIAGRRCYGLETTDVEEARRFREIIEETFGVSGASSLGDFLPVFRLVEYWGLEKRLVRLQAKRDAFMQDLIDNHRKREADGGGEEKRKTILDVLLSLQQSDPQCYTDKIIKGVVLVFRASPLGWGLAQLVKV